MKYTDIAWDFDGTLFDSYPSCVREFSELLKSYGYEESDEAIMDQLVITSRHAKAFFAAKYHLDLGELNRRYKGFSSFRPEEVKPFPGIEEVLKSIKESGRRNHLYTNRDHSAIEYLEHCGLTRYFDGFITGEEMEKLKPDPSGAFLMRDMYHIAPGKLLMVGDRTSDIDSVKPAGFDGCFYNTNNTEIPENADYALDRDKLAGLLDII